MILNSPQKAVLAVCAGIVAAMMLYPPLQVRGFGRGYGWLFALDEGLTINAAQLLVQWVGVCLVGAIAFVLAGAAQLRPATGGARGLAGRLGAAYRSSRQWMWILLAMVAAAVVLAPDPRAAALQAMGKLGAALIIYALVFGWYLLRPRSVDLRRPARTTSWKRIGLYVLAAALSLLVVNAWIKHQTQSLDSPPDPSPTSNGEYPRLQFDPPAVSASRPVSVSR